MMRNVLENIPGIEYYPMIALILFVTFFGGLLIWSLLADKKKLAERSAIPLDDEMSIVPDQPRTINR